MSHTTATPPRTIDADRFLQHLRVMEMVELMVKESIFGHTLGTGDGHIFPTPNTEGQHQ